MKQLITVNNNYKNAFKSLEFSTRTLYNDKLIKQRIR